MHPKPKNKHIDTFDFASRTVRSLFTRDAAQVHGQYRRFLLLLCSAGWQHSLKKIYMRVVSVGERDK